MKVADIMTISFFHADNMKALRELPDCSIDSVVTDPPYGLGKEPDALVMLKDWLEFGHHDVESKVGFKGSEWDSFVPQPNLWKEVYRVLKPGGYVLSFASTRTQDLMGLGLRLAGFEMRDLIAWIYGSGMPKSLDVATAVCKEDSSKSENWDGWGSNLKPALEPITMARKPLCGTIAKNIVTYGVGAINIDGCRVEPATSNETTNDGLKEKTPKGRHPANLIHDGSDEVMDAFAVFGEKKSCMSPSSARSPGTILGGSRTQGNLPMDSGTAARFFYCAKANKADRDGSLHPTVKPIALMRYLVRLVTPPGGVVLDPFAGSGTTGQAAVDEGVRAILIERENEYAEDIRRRLVMYISEDKTMT